MERTPRCSAIDSWLALLKALRLCRGHGQVLEPSDSAKGVATTDALHNWVLYISALCRRS
jgi:hypothetical protein